MDTLVGSSNQACLPTASQLLQWAAVIKNIGHVATTFTKLAIISEVIGAGF
jgi:hypothetical protein